MRSIILVVFSLFIALAFNSDGSAQMYKYIDKNGVMHFTDTPTDSKYRAISEPEPEMSERDKLKAKIENLKLLYLQQIQEAFEVNKGNPAYAAKILNILIARYEQEIEKSEFVDVIPPPIPPPEVLIPSGGVFIGSQTGKLYYPNGKGMVLDSQTGNFILIR